MTKLQIVPTRAGSFFRKASYPVPGGQYSQECKGALYQPFLSQPNSGVNSMLCAPAVIGNTLPVMQ